MTNHAALPVKDCYRSRRSVARLAVLSALLQMIRFIVRLTRLPHFPGHCQPTIGQAAVGMAVRVTVRAHLLPIGVGPGRVSQRSHGPLLRNHAELAVTRLPKFDNLFLATGSGDRASARQRLDTRRAWKARPVVAKL